MLCGPRYSQPTGVVSPVSGKVGPRAGSVRGGHIRAQEWAAPSPQTGGSAGPHRRDSSLHAGEPPAKGTVTLSEACVRPRLVLEPLTAAFVQSALQAAHAVIVMGSVVGSLLDPVGSQHSLSLPSLQARAAGSAGMRLPPAGWTDNFHSSHLPPQRQAWKELLECMGGSCLEGSERLWVSLVTVARRLGLSDAGAGGDRPSSPGDSTRSPVIHGRW